MTTLRAAENFSGANNGTQVTEVTSPRFTRMGQATGTASMVHTTEHTLEDLTRGAKVTGTAYQYGRTDLASHTNHRHRLTIFMTERPAAGQYWYPYEVLLGDNSAVAAQVRIDSNGDLMLRNGTTVLPDSGASTWWTVPLNTVVDLQITYLGAGDQTVRAFTGADRDSNTSGEATATLTGALTATTFGRTNEGKIAATSSGFTGYILYSANISDSADATPYPIVAPVVEVDDPGNVQLMRMVGNVWVEHEILRKVSGSWTLMALDRYGFEVPAPTGSFSSILVPSSGCLFGAETPTNTLGKKGSDLTGLEQYEAFSGREPDIEHFYKTGAWNGQVSTSERAQAVRAGKRRSIIMYNWKPSGTWADIASGSADAQIDAAAVGIRNWAHKGFLTIYHEPEDNVGQATGYTAANYVSMFNHVVTRLRSQGVGRADEGGKCVIVLNLMGYRTWKTLIPTLIPSTTNFDWGGWDPYAFVEGGVPMTPATFFNQTASGWPGFYAWWMANYPSKPLMCPEWGVNHATSNFYSTAQEAAFYASLPAAMQSSFSNIKGLILWNSDTQADNGYNYRVNDRGSTVTSAFRTMNNHAHFNAVSTDDAP